MFISSFVLGIFATLSVEFIILFFGALIKYIFNNKKG